MGSAFNTVMKIISALIGLLMVCGGGIWILQVLNIAFLQGSFMAGDPKWAVYGVILALVGLGQLVWSIRRPN